MIMSRDRKADAARRYFMMPNEIFRLGLNGGEILVYACLLYFEDRKTYSCYPSFRTIGETIGMSKNTVRKYVTGLEKKRLITTEPTRVTLKNGRKRNGNLLYHIRPIEEAAEYYDALQMKKLTEQSAKARARKLLEEYDRKHPKQNGSRNFSAEHSSRIPGTPGTFSAKCSEKSTGSKE